MFIEVFLEDDIEDNVISFRDYADRTGAKTRHSYVDDNATRAGCDVISLLERRN